MSGTGDSSFKKISLLLLLDIISINYVLFYKFSRIWIDDFKSSISYCILFKKKKKENYLIPTSSNAGRLLEREYTIWPSRMSGSGWLALNWCILTGRQYLWCKDHPSSFYDWINDQIVYQNRRDTLVEECRFAGLIWSEHNELEWGAQTGSMFLFLLDSNPMQQQHWWVVKCYLEIYNR